MAGSRIDARQPDESRKKRTTRVPLEDVLRRLPSAVVIAEAPGGKLLHVNPLAERIWRRSFAEVEGVEDYGIWQGIRADGELLGPQDWPLARTVRQGEVTDERDIEIIRGDETRAIVRISSFPIYGEQGRVVAGVLTCRDVTRQKRWDEARRLLAESRALLAAPLDPERTLRGVARLVVPTLADWCSIDLLGGDQGLERRVVEYSGADDAGVGEEAPPPGNIRLDADRVLVRVLRDGAGELVRKVDEYLLRELARGDEDLRFLRAVEPCCAMIVPLVARGRILGVISVIAARKRVAYDVEDLELVQDLAARMALAIDNAQLYEESQAAIRAKADFLAVISHELRTPLTAIIGYSELLSLGVPEPLTNRQKEQIDRIEVSGRHLLQLIEEILTTASLETGRATVHRERVKIQDLLRQAEELTRPLASAKGLSLQIDSEDAGIMVQSDPDKLLQVLLNLLSNAIKFTDRGRIRVTAEQDAREIVVKVRDTGIGVEPRHVERIFDPFWQAEKPITRRTGGTGLGLAISRRLVELLGGKVEVEVNPGGGSTFAVRLPTNE